MQILKTLCDANIDKPSTECGFVFSLGSKENTTFQHLCLGPDRTCVEVTGPCFLCMLCDAAKVVLMRRP